MNFVGYPKNDFLLSKTNQYIYMKYLIGNDKIFIPNKQ